MKNGQIICVDCINTQRYLGSETVDPVKLCSESDALCLFFFHIIVYECEDVYFNVVDSSVRPGVEVSCYFVVGLFVSDQIKMSYEDNCPGDNYPEGNYPPGQLPP